MNQKNRSTTSSSPIRDDQEKSTASSQSTAGFDERTTQFHNKPPLTEWEYAARICEEMRPSGGRMWTPEQAACFEALTTAADLIRNREKIHLSHALKIADDSRFSRAARSEAQLSKKLRAERETLHRLMRPANVPPDSGATQKGGPAE